MLKFDVFLKKLTSKKKSEIGNHTRQTFGIVCSKDRTHPRTCVFTFYEYSQYSQYIGIDPHAPAFLHGRAPSSFLPSFLPSLDRSLARSTSLSITLFSLSVSRYDLSRPRLWVNSNISFIPEYLEKFTKKILNSKKCLRYVATIES